MESRSIQTDAGTLDLIPATMDQIHGIARHWPMGLVESPGDGSPFGLVFQRGELEVHGIKMQPVDIPESDATTFHHVNRALIASALPRYLEKQHRGLMVPCAYYREKGHGKVETGIAFFVGPDEPSSGARGKDDILYDHQLGDGATQMIFDMAGAIAAASKTLHLPLMTTIGMDLRPGLAMGGLAMHFVADGRRVFVIKHPLQEDEPVWEYVVRAGFSELPYAPMRPAALPA